MSGDGSLLREALEEAKQVDGRLERAHADQMARTARTLNLAIVAVAGQLTVITLIVQTAISVPFPLRVVIGVGLAMTLTAVGVLVAALANLPNDSLLSWGSMPWVYGRLAVRAARDEDRWLAALLDELDERVRHNAGVIVVLVRRRNVGLVVGGAGTLLSFASMALISGGGFLA